MNDRSQEQVGRVSETRFSLLEQRVGGVEKAVNDLTSKIDIWITSRQTNPWRVVALLLGILVPLGFILNLYITSAISPWAAIANQAKATADANTVILSHMSEDMGVVKSQNAASIQDRTDKGKQIDELIRSNAETAKLLASETSQRQANEAEFETQIDSMAQGANTVFAEMFRWLSNNQNSLHDMGAKMPAAPTAPFFFPNISNRNHRKPN